MKDSLMLRLDQRVSALLASSRGLSNLACTSCRHISSGSLSRKSCSKRKQDLCSPSSESIPSMRTDGFESPSVWKCSSLEAHSHLSSPKVSTSRDFSVMYLSVSGGRLIRSINLVAVSWSSAVVPCVVRFYVLQVKLGLRLDEPHVELGGPKGWKFERYCVFFRHGGTFRVFWVTNVAFARQDNPKGDNTTQYN